MQLQKKSEDVALLGLGHQVHLNWSPLRMHGHRLSPRFFQICSQLIQERPCNPKLLLIQLQRVARKACPILSRGQRCAKILQNHPCGIGLLPNGGVLTGNVVAETGPCIGQQPDQLGIRRFRGKDLQKFQKARKLPWPQEQQPGMGILGCGDRVAPPCLKLSQLFDLRNKVLVQSSDLRTRKQNLKALQLIILVPRVPRSLKTQPHLMYSHGKVVQLAEPSQACGRAAPALIQCESMHQVSEISLGYDIFDRRLTRPARLTLREDQAGPVLRAGQVTRQHTVPEIPLHKGCNVVRRAHEGAFNVTSHFGQPKKQIGNSIGGVYHEIWLRCVPKLVDKFQECYPRGLDIPLLQARQHRAGHLEQLLQAMHQVKRIFISLQVLTNHVQCVGKVGLLAEEFDQRLGFRHLAKVGCHPRQQLMKAPLKVSQLF
eukprot:RCo025622